MQNTSMALECVPNSINDQGRGIAPLFSAISMKDTEFSKTWATLLPEAKKNFPEIKFENLNDLHITLVYIGPNWDITEFEQYSEQGLALPQPDELPLKLLGKPSIFGSKADTLVVELDQFAPDWAQRIVDARVQLAEQGWRAASSFDTQFKPHVSLGRIKADTSAARKDQFVKWLESKNAQTHLFEVLLTSNQEPQYFLSEKPLTPDGPLYTPLKIRCTSAEMAPLFGKPI